MSIYLNIIKYQIIKGYIIDIHLIVEFADKP